MPYFCPVFRSPFRVLRSLAAAVAILLAAGSLQPVFAGQPKQHKHDGRHQIDQLEEAWRIAVLKSDANAMSALLAEDFMGITWQGTLQTKDQLLANMRSGRIHLTTLEILDRKVRFYGKTAVVTSVSHMEGTNIDGDLTGNFRYTRVYVKNQQGEWKIVSFESSRIHGSGMR